MKDSFYYQLMVHNMPALRVCAVADFSKLLNSKGNKILALVDGGTFAPRMGSA